ARVDPLDAPCPPIRPQRPIHVGKARPLYRAVYPLTWLAFVALFRGNRYSRRPTGTCFPDVQPPIVRLPIPRVRSAHLSPTPRRASVRCLREIYGQLSCWSIPFGIRLEPTILPRP